jgi:hypothetical protein
MNWDQEELIGLGVLLLVIIGLALAAKLTQESVEAIKWIGGTFMTSKGLSKLLPKSQ